MEPTMSPVTREQRFTPAHRCPICGGWEDQPRGQGVRCFGWEAPPWVYCSREEYAEVLKMDPNTFTFRHRLNCRCDCGKRHDGARTALILEPGRVGRAHS